MEVVEEIVENVWKVLMPQLSAWNGKQCSLWEVLTSLLKGQRYRFVHLTIQYNNLSNSPLRGFSELKYLPKNYLNNYNAI